MSALIPFGLFLNVGGNNDSIAKLIVCPAALAASTEIVNKLLLFPGVVVGDSSTVACLQVVWDPDTGTFAEARTWPEVV